MPVPYRAFFAPTNDFFPWRRIPWSPMDGQVGEMPPHAFRIRHTTQHPDRVYEVCSGDPTFDRNEQFWKICLFATKRDPTQYPLVIVPRHAPRWLPPILALTLDLRRAYDPGLCERIEAIERVMLDRLLLLNVSGRYSLDYSRQRLVPTDSFSDNDPQNDHPSLGLRSILLAAGVALDPVPSGTINAFDPTLNEPLRRLFPTIPRTRIYLKNSTSYLPDFEFDLPKSVHQRLNMLRTLRASS